MMRGPPMLAWIRPAQSTLLPPVALEHRRIQIQAISCRTSRKPLQLPTPQAGEKTLALSLTETFEQVANGVIDRKARDPQHRVQGHVGTQQTRVCEAPRSGHHRGEERGEGLS